MALQYRATALTHPGKIRRNNQDFVAFFEPDGQEDLQASGRLYIVADGVGGASKGEQASQYAAQKVLYEYYRHPDIKINERLTSVMRQAGNEIFKFAENSENFSRMGTTMVVAVIQDDRLTIANVGDSRAYLIRDGTARQITRDHSFVGEMIRDGTMTEEEARHSKIKNRITRSLGGETDVIVDIFNEIQIQAGDKILLCSDGFSKYTSREEIEELTSNGSPEDIANKMIDLANDRGGTDNISVIVIDANLEVADQDTPVSTHGQAPQAVEWDTLTTEPGISKDQPKPIIPIPIQLPIGNRRMAAYLLIGILFVSIVVLGFISGKKLLAKKTIEDQPTLTETSKEGMLAVTSSVTHTTTEGVSESTILATTMDQPGVVLQQTDTPLTTMTTLPTSITNTPLVSATATITGTPFLIPQLVTCQITYDQKFFDLVRDDAMLLMREILKVNVPENFFDYAQDIKCSEISGNDFCDYSNDESSYVFISVNWVLDFPDIPQNKCEAAGGINVDKP